MSARASALAAHRRSRHAHLDAALAELLGLAHARVDVALDVTLQALVEVLEHGGAAGEHNVLAARPAKDDGRSCVALFG